MLLEVEPLDGGKEKVVARFPYAEISEAKLVLTDALIAEARARRPASGAIADASDWNGPAGGEIHTGDENGRHDS